MLFLVACFVVLCLSKVDCRVLGSYVGDKCQLDQNCYSKFELFPMQCVDSICEQTKPDPRGYSCGDNSPCMSGLLF